MKVFARDLWLQSSKLLVYIGLIFNYPLSDTGSASKESSSKALVVNDDSKEESDDDDYDEEDDELSLVTRKIIKMWKNKNSFRFNGLSKRSFHKKEKNPIIWDEC
ncbi:hypothetical protein JHK87_044632 [Glycine soja]|nr:hypothetical protein JHK87_044632 [Glycine soja]